jgi:ceramide glucosyltransferase
MLAVLAVVLTAIATVQCVAGWTAVVWFAARSRKPARVRPAVTVLKPLHGDEPGLEQALETVCRQRYPTYQVVFGVQDAADPAAAVVRRLQSRFPARDLALVVDPTQHGRNRKVSNLINMFPAARHDMLVIADSDLHVAPDYLERLVAALEPPGVGLATTLYVGIPPASLARERQTQSRFGVSMGPSVIAALGATQITHGFLPGALLGRVLGREDCLGATMILRRDTLRRIGGLPALVDHLADDNALGRLVQEVALGVALADTVPLTTVPERTLAELFRHELRWARTIRALAPFPFAASVLQYPIFWALIAALLLPFGIWSWILVLAAWAIRATAARGIDRALVSRTGPLPKAALWLLPLRELMSITVMIVSYGGLQVEWRGHRLMADGPATLTAVQERD